MTVWDFVNKHSDVLEMILIMCAGLLLPAIARRIGDSR